VELIIFTGIQACGKSTFFKQRFADTHIRLNMDMLRTRHREKLLFRACLEAKAPTVIDNTNPTRAERARYIEPARNAQFTVIGYCFESKLEDCKRRNDLRSGAQAIPLPGLLGTYARLEKPSLDEGFTHLYHVRINDQGQFVTEEWCHEV
jgi:predicted kinase